MADAITRKDIEDIALEQIKAWTESAQGKQIIDDAVATKFHKNSYLGERQKLDLARFASASQWLIASLMAVNTAGIVFTGDATNLRDGVPSDAMGLFLAGIILSLFAGFFYRLAARWHIYEVAVAVGQVPFPKRWFHLHGWIKSSDGYFKEDEIEKIVKFWDFFSVLFSWASFVMFLLGACTVYQGSI